MRHHTLGPIYFLQHIPKRIRRNVLMQVQFVISTTDERLRQIDGVRYDRDHGQEVAMPDPVLG